MDRRINAVKGNTHKKAELVRLIQHKQKLNNIASEKFEVLMQKDENELRYMLQNLGGERITRVEEVAKIRRE